MQSTTKISCLNCSKYIQNEKSAFLFSRLKYCYTNVISKDGRCSRWTMHIKKPVAADILQPKWRYFFERCLCFRRTNNHLWISSINTSLFMKHCTSGENHQQPSPKILSIQETKIFIKPSNIQLLLICLIILSKLFKK